MAEWHAMQLNPAEHPIVRSGTFSAFLSCGENSAFHPCIWFELWEIVQTQFCVPVIGLGKRVDVTEGDEHQIVGGGHPRHFELWESVQSYEGR